MYYTFLYLKYVYTNILFALLCNIYNLLKAIQEVRKADNK